MARAEMMGAYDADAPGEAAPQGGTAPEGAA
jgi:hypothetical protein